MRPISAVQLAIAISQKRSVRSGPGEVDNRMAAASACGFAALESSQFVGRAATDRLYSGDLACDASFLADAVDE